MSANLHYLTQGISALQAGDPGAARGYLIELIRREPEHELGWLWLALAMRSPAKIRFCLERVLTINPDNGDARRALDALRQQSPPPPPPRPRVLIVDDSSTVRRVIALALQPGRFQIGEAGSGAAALEAVARQVPDLLLLDVNMPDMDGFHVCRTLRTGGHPQLPIIMLSGHDSFFDRVRGHLAGATRYVVKPFQPDDLLTLVDEQLRAAAVAS